MADKPRERRPSNRTILNPSTDAIRDHRPSNRPTQHQQQRQPRAPRPSNRATTVLTAQPINLTISDGPAPAKIRTANLYDINDLVQMLCVADGAYATLACRIRLPDGSIAGPRATDGQASYRAQQSGQHWYAFDALDNLGEVLGTAEAVFVVRTQQVPR